MTVCVAAICEQGKSIVVAADRMVTGGPPMNIEFEHDRSKISRLTETCVALNAGDALLAHEILRTIEGLLQPQLDVDSLGNALVDSYRSARQGRIEETLRAVGLTFASFLADGLKQLGPIFPNMVQQIQAMNANTELLLAGFTTKGEARIGFIHNPGALRWYDPMGFHAIGSGAMHAVLSLISSGHSASLSLERAAFQVYAAKRSAEAAPGVGRATDLLILNAKAAGPKIATDAIFAEMSSLYDKVRAPSAVSYDALKGFLNGDA
jgi:hypothetical protein